MGEGGRKDARKEEIHPEGVESRENIVHKRRKVNQAGEYKKVLAMHKPSRDLEMDRGTEQEECKRMKLEDQQGKRILGQVMHGYVLEDPIDWEEERRKRQEYIEQEENMRQERIRKARRLEESWKLSNLCREFIRENSQVWQIRMDEHKAEMDRIEKAERVKRAEYKKGEYRMEQMKRDKSRKITEMLMELPKDDQERWRRDQRQEEGRLLKEIKDNMWKRWRGKLRRKQQSEVIPKEEEKLDAKIKEIESRIQEYKQEMQRVAERKDKKKKLEEHWQMMKWLTSFIEENRYTWERRRQIQEEEYQMNEIFEDWMKKDAETQIADLKKDKALEKSMETEKLMRVEKARERRKLWKEWRRTEKEQNQAGDVSSETPSMM